MLASLHPNSPTSDQAVKDLIDHRARASHTRYSSVSFSQRSDSPSIYSRGDYSPGAQYRPSADWPSGRPSYAYSVAGQSAFDDAEDHIHNPFARSSFDHDDESSRAADDDDCVSFISALTPKIAVPPASDPPDTRNVELDADSPPSEDIDDDPRMSILGPKMRFVSKAPWELGDDDLLEEDEEDSGGAAEALTMFSHRMSNWRNREHDKSSAKSLGLRSNSPAPSLPDKKNPSTFSMGLQHQTTGPLREGPYGNHLTGASQSHSAIHRTLTSSSRSQHSVTESLSSDQNSHKFPRERCPDPFPPLPFPTHAFRPHTTSHSSRGGSSSASFRSISPPLSGQYIHPYANPDIIPMPAPAPLSPLPKTPGMGAGRYSDEQERQVSPLRRASESATSPPRGKTLRKASAGAITLPAMSLKTTMESHDEDDVTCQPLVQPRPRTSSKPKPLPSSPMRTTMSYEEQQGSPLHNLITLEQARARTQGIANKGYSSSNTSTPHSKPTPGSTLVAGLGLSSDTSVDNGVILGRTPRPNPSLPPADSASGPPLQQQRQASVPRQRTISAGKHMFGSSSGVDADAVSTKSLKHKKSAFMKLFQGNKDKERERDHSRESVSPRSEYPIRAMSTPPQLPPTESVVPPVPTLHNIKRVPPPLPLSVVVTSPSFPPSDPPSQENASARSGSPPRQRQASLPLPPGSQAPINPHNQGSWQAPELPTSQASASVPLRPVMSAPSSQTSFEALSLRPVSTIFSAKFPDLLSPVSSSSNMPLAVGSSLRLEESPPTTPGFVFSRSSISTASDFPTTPTTGPVSVPLGSGEDQSSIVAALQEQLVNSRKLWQRQIWELEGQVKDLKEEVEELRNTAECESCGKVLRERKLRTPVPQNVSVVDRPRPRLGGGNTRSMFGGGNDM